MLHQNSVESRQVHPQPNINSPTFGDVREGHEHTGPEKEANLQATSAEQVYQ